MKLVLLLRWCLHVVQQYATITTGYQSADFRNKGNKINFERHNDIGFSTWTTMVAMVAMVATLPGPTGQRWFIYSWIF